jgi:hypothetical protein
MAVVDIDDMHPAEQELLEMTDVEYGSATKRVADLRKLYTAITKLSDDDWDALSDSAQQWADEAPKHEAGGRITLVDFHIFFGEDQTVDPEEEGDEPEEDNSTPYPLDMGEDGLDVTGSPQPGPEDPEYYEEVAAVAAKKKKAKKKAAKKKAAKKAPVVKTSKAGKRLGKRSDSHTMCRKIVLQRRELSRVELIALCKKKGHSLTDSSMTTLLYHTEQTLKLLLELGFDVPPLLPRSAARKAELRRETLDKARAAIPTIPPAALKKGATQTS